MKKSKGYLGKRLAKGLAQIRGEESQNQFAKKLGISNATLNRLENKVQNISLATIEKLCRNLDCDVADLFPDIDKKEK